MSRVIPLAGFAPSTSRAPGRLRRLPPRLLAGVFLLCWCPSDTRPGPCPLAEGGQVRPEGAAPPAKPGPVTPQEVVFAVPDDAEAWSYLPGRVRGAEAPLPLWARALARTLPRTTAAMLELDHAHRAGSPLDPRLRGLVRWAAARAVRCGYCEAYALADLRAAKLAEDEIRALTGDPERLPEETRRLLAFVRRLSTAGYLVTDEEVAYLVGRYGPQQVVAIVLCVAYSNFLDRLVLALGLPVEPGGPLPPQEVAFAPVPVGTSLAAPRTPPPARPAALTSPVTTREAGGTDLLALQKEIEKQRTRRPRIRLPRREPGAIHWGLVCRTYQPELAAAWALCRRNFGAEANQDPVFEASVFWVVTQARESFY